MYNEKLSRVLEKFFTKFKVFRIIGWLLAIGFFWFHTLKVKTLGLTKTQQNFYNSIVRELWACAVCWIIFACHTLKSGGFIRTFLSHRFWQPLSKLTLSMYLIHMPFLIYTEIYYKIGFGILWYFHIIIGDVFFTILFATIAYVVIECPVGKLLDLAWKRKNKTEVKTVEEKIPLIHNADKEIPEEFEQFENDKCLSDTQKRDRKTNKVLLL
jgi:peptidoglycan/LPS O-acetylase OafA/YrhL